MPTTLCCCEEGDGCGICCHLTQPTSWTVELSNAVSDNCADCSIYEGTYTLISFHTVDTCGWGRDGFGGCNTISACTTGDVTIGILNAVGGQAVQCNEVNPHTEFRFTLRIKGPDNVSILNCDTHTEPLFLDSDGDCIKNFSFTASPTGTTNGCVSFTVDVTAVA